MKSPAPNMDITQLQKVQPRVLLAWQPIMPNGAGGADVIEVVPSILIAPTIGDVKNVEEKRFDTYNHVHRPQEFGQWLNVTMLFSVYEPGIRLPGFVTETAGKKIVDVSKLKEGTEEGFFTLFDWIDECTESLIAQKTIPGTDLIVDEQSMQYSPYLSGGFIADKRPVYYGFVNVKFQCFADKKFNKTIEKHLL